MNRLIHIHILTASLFLAYSRFVTPTVGGLFKSTTMSTSRLSNELLFGAAAGAAGTLLLHTLLHRWFISPNLTSKATDDVELSTTSSGHSGDVYETSKALDEYLLFHFGAPNELLPYVGMSGAPFEALDFAVRTAELCAQWGGNNGAAGKDLGVALDMGCATGRSSFEMTRLGYSSVVGMDFSHRFVNAAADLAKGKVLPFSMQVEGGVTASGEARAPKGSKPETCTFLQGDACALDIDALLSLTKGEGYSLVHAANLLCRLPDPRAFLRSLPALLAPGGIYVNFSPYSWLPQYTAPEKWLGGKLGARSADVFKSEMEALGFELVAQQDVPFLIREHARKFQFGISHATAWRMKKV